MKVQHLILTAVLASGITTSVYAADDDTNSNMQPNMPMMQGPQGQMPMGYTQGQPMHPMMMQHMMRMQQQGNNMPMTNRPGGMMNQQGGMPMMGARNNMGNPMQGDAGMMNQPGRMGMMNRGGTPMMEMMQQKHVMMQAHMVKVESHLANIEALLRQIAEKK